MPLPCQYSEHGCEEELYRDRLVHHEETCQFRPICCVDIACNAKVPFSKMLDHMSKDHESGDFVHANGSEYKVTIDPLGRGLRDLADPQSWSLDSLFYTGCLLFKMSRSNTLSNGNNDHFWWNCESDPRRSLHVLPLHLFAFLVFDVQSFKFYSMHLTLFISLAVLFHCQSGRFYSGNNVD